MSSFQTIGFSKLESDGKWFSSHLVYVTIGVKSCRIMLPYYVIRNSYSNYVQFGQAKHSGKYLLCYNPNPSENTENLSNR